MAKEKFLVFNYKPSTKIKTPEEIPTLSNVSDLPVFLEDKSPFYKTEAIDFPAVGNGGIYTKQFFKSFINGLKNRPYPGSKRGHEYQSRPNTDFYTVGGMIEENADGKTGTAYLKMYIPPRLDSDNYGFMNDCMAGIVHFSLVSAPEFQTKKDDSGAETKHFTASKGYERNDAVEYGAGAMAQVVNSENSMDFELAKELINKGAFDKTTKTQGDIIQDGKVFYCALGREVAVANGESKTALVELISLIDKKYNERGKTMDKEELLKTLGNLVKNGQTNISEIAESVGLGKQVRNEADEKNEKIVNELASKFGADYMTEIDKIKKENDANVQSAIENAITLAVGGKTIKNAEGKDVSNPKYIRAAELCRGLRGEELKNAIEKFPEDELMKIINASMISERSGFVRIEGTGNADGKKPESESKVKTY